MSNITLPNDPEVKIPNAVKAAGAMAEQLHKGAYEIETPPEGETSAAPPPQEGFTEAPLTAEGKQIEISKPLTASDENDESWAHKYRTMKGRFDKSQKQIAGLSDQINSLQQVIATMQLQPVAAPPTGEMSAERFITPDELDAYGEEFLTVVGKKAREELLPEIRKRDDEIARLKSQLSGVNGYVSHDAQSRMEQQLDNSVANWRELNYNPDFLSWLALPDSYSGAIRHELLKEAWDRRDASRVANFFKGFLAEEAVVAPVGSEPDRSGTPVVKVPLESLAAPGRAKTAASGNTTPAEKPTFTRAQIAAFYADAASGKFRGREADKERLERQIFDAQRDGRIRN